jgi:23S rRNA (uridine2552-2'-O)-methyltransferase
MYRKGRKNEFYTKLAHKEGYPARSVYKLKEIDEKFHLIKKGDKVLDLGSAPGSWILYLSRKVGNKGKVFGFDLEEIKIPLPNNVIFFQKDIAVLEESDFKEKYQAVVADLSPKTSGISEIDVARSLELSEKALEITKMALAKGGNFACKIFETESTPAFFKKVKANFKHAKRFRPKAVIKGSREFYIIGKGFRQSIDKI